MDNELFELCKRVYEKTGWNPGYWHTEKYGVQRQDGTFNDGSIKTVPVITAEPIAPAYTSDYLLDKLPATVENTDYKSGGIDRSKHIALQLRKWDRFVNGGMVYFAEYHEMYHTPLFRTEADTPLKALLKLILALHEAGEL